MGPGPHPLGALEPRERACMQANIKEKITSNTTRITANAVVLGIAEVSDEEIEDNIEHVGHTKPIFLS